MKKIGIEKGLANVAGYLISNSYTVEMLSDTIDKNKDKLSGYDCIVTSGVSTDSFGFSEEAPVINANGLTPTEVLDKINTMQG